MNTRTLWKRLRRAKHETLWGERISVDIRFPEPQSVLAALPPPFPKIPPDLVQGCFWGNYHGIEDDGKEGVYTRMVRIEQRDGATPTSDFVVPGTLTEDEIVDGVQLYKWYEVVETNIVDDRYVDKAYPIEPWVLQDIALYEWSNKTYYDEEHAVLKRVQGIHDLSSKKSVYIDLSGGVHFVFCAKTYSREHMMRFCKAVSRAVRFAKRQGVEVQVKV